MSNGFIRGFHFSLCSLFLAGLIASLVAGITLREIGIYSLELDIYIARTSSNITIVNTTMFDSWIPPLNFNWVTFVFFLFAWVRSGNIFLRSMCTRPVLPGRRSMGIGLWGEDISNEPIWSWLIEMLTVIMHCIITLLAAISVQIPTYFELVVIFVTTIICWFLIIFWRIPPIKTLSDIVFGWGYKWVMIITLSTLGWIQIVYGVSRSSHDAHKAVVCLAFIATFVQFSVGQYILYPRRRKYEELDEYGERVMDYKRTSITHAIQSVAWPVWVLHEVLILSSGIALIASVYI